MAESALSWALWHRPHDGPRLQDGQRKGPRAPLLQRLPVRSVGQPSSKAVFLSIIPKLTKRNSDKTFNCDRKLDQKSPPAHQRWPETKPLTSLWRIFTVCVSGTLLPQNLFYLCAQPLREQLPTTGEWATTGGAAKQPAQEGAGVGGVEGMLKEQRASPGRSAGRAPEGHTVLCEHSHVWIYKMWK